mmetsp:Transcript_109973/g.164500  ORF Transcript_109973/g.164500 Transcript_109973/m.164500 type:complete len:568 (-) Transcript_109973:83-1786(-)|eukprot:CAMPEP_0117025132 /NCGR_PEP_ID=MMETSP0472-20121206/18597_1 /TAXON_ID=693140 ORGANISM="Tiarina fusus, Strain LIS" /NCGR_SAMPLE_ID=MMETSP0472 /ASSEMBLY_ACC=CAM_ASM_000603 /LENGTH=567 /DNA_ID=CAMNT_0004731765 /DNA_START=62 /DNA_END=1765 /DNA_ORIENTATION=+
MLRVMKKKILNEEETSHEHNTPETPFSCPSVMVSHVPVSVGSRSVPASTSSSISSKGGAECFISQVSESRTPIVNLPGRKRRLHRQLPQNSPIESSDESSPECSFGTAMLCYQQEDTLLKCQNNEAHPTGTRMPLPKKQRLDEKARALKLLALEEDSTWLSPLHNFVRSQIEVFAATSEDLAQPAPGRKQPIKLNQVGLRCIHCRDLPSRKRVKRAVCYPSSVARVYHSVSDMKFDHFSNCKSMPLSSRTEFERLKADGAKTTGEKKSRGSSSSTSKYYQEAALKKGMMDGDGGIFLRTPQATIRTDSAFPALKPMLTPRPGNAAQQSAPPPVQSVESVTRIQAMQHIMLLNALTQTNQISQPRSSQKSHHEQMRIRLQDDDDTKHLNPLHCFVRRHVEFFTADKADIAAPAPGRKARVVLGQVGIRCVHCAKLPAKERVKRSICYPPSIRAIYHSVSNMKFDHFAICKGLPAQARKEFQTLKASCSRSGTAGNNTGRRGSSSSTAQYYQDSAVSKGLVDTQTGIFMRPSQGNMEHAQGLGLPKTTTPPIPAGLSTLMQAISQAGGT